MKNLLGMLDLKELARRLASVDRHLFSVLGVRLGSGGISDLVALVKQNEERKKTDSSVFPILRPDIENQRLAMGRHWARTQNVDANFGECLLNSVIAESCRVQAGCMHRYKDEASLDDKDPGAIYEFQRQRLLELTRVVAPSYDQMYSDQFFGTKQYLEFENAQINQVVNKLSNHNRMVDLGCATGRIALQFASRFREVMGFDLSEHKHLQNSRISRIF